MTLKYRIIEDNLNLYYPEYFEGIWIFGTWKRLGSVCMSMECAESEIIKWAHTVLASHDKVVREITVK